MIYCGGQANIRLQLVLTISKIVEAKMEGPDSPCQAGSPVEVVSSRHKDLGFALLDLEQMGQSFNQGPTVSMINVTLSIKTV